jgi:hypothetical protein
MQSCDKSEAARAELSQRCDAPAEASLQPEVFLLFFIIYITVSIVGGLGLGGSVVAPLSRPRSVGAFMTFRC